MRVDPGRDTAVQNPVGDIRDLLPRESLAPDSAAKGVAGESWPLVSREFFR